MMRNMKILIKTKENRSFAANLVGNIKGDEGMEVIIQPHIDKKTDEQRAWFHVLCREMSAETGYTEGQIKEIIKQDVFGISEIFIGNRERYTTCSSEIDENGEPRSKPSYTQLIEGAYQLAAEAGIQLPNPIYREVV